jgi:four helix bundle protein
MQDFRRLRVWEKAHAFALDVHQECGRFPRREGSVLTGQLRRASLSVAANIAEGAGKGSDREFRRFLQIAMGSALEADYHLLVARDTGFIGGTTYDDLSGRAAEIRRMLGGLIRRLDAPPNADASSHTPFVPDEPRADEARRS